MQFRPQPRKLERGKGRYENSLSSLPPSPVYSASVHPFLHFPLPSFPLSPSRQHPLTFTSHFFLSPPSPLPLSAHFSFWQVIALCKRALLPSSFLLDRRRRYGGEGKKEITQAANRPCCPGGIALYTYIESVSLLPPHPSVRRNSNLHHLCGEGNSRLQLAAVSPALKKWSNFFSAGRQQKVEKRASYIFRPFFPR